MTIPATLLGLAIGDALGVPFEFKNTEVIRRSGWNGDFKPTNRWGGLSAGQWSDDTKMAIHLSLGLITNSGFDRFAIMNQYLKWFNSGDLRGIGGQTHDALFRAKLGEDLNDCGRIDLKKAGFKSNKFCGNGTVMRCAPIGVYFRNDPEQMRMAATQDAVLTHNHPDAKDASIALCMAIKSIIEKRSTDNIVKSAVRHIDAGGNVKEAIVRGYNAFLTGKDYFELLKSLDNSGRADTTLGTAIYCFAKYRGDYRTTIVEAIKMGGDTDTRAAIAGSMSGADVGLEGIPKDYIAGVEDNQFLQAVDTLLYASSQLSKMK